MNPLRSNSLDGYVRVSDTGDKGDDARSPGQQRAAITAWAASRGVTIGKWHEDLDVSGGTLTRPALDALLARIRSGETGGVVVARLDRLSRAGVGDALKLIEDIAEHGGQVVAVDLGLDPTTPAGELMLTLMLALARMERRRITDGWALSRAGAIRRGVSIALAPLGYVRGDDGRLVLDDAPRSIVRTREVVTPHEVVREAFRLAAASGPHAALDYLREYAGGQQWPDLMTARRFLARRVFLGEVASGEYVQTEAHDPLVDIATFTAAQSIANPARRRPTGDYPLSGLVTCASCGSPLKGNRSGKPVNGAPKRRYSCSARGTCDAPVSIDAERLETAIFAAYRRGLVAAIESAGGDQVIRRAAPALDELQAALDLAERRLQQAGAPEVQDAFGDQWAAMAAARRDARDDAALALGHARSVAGDVTVTPAMRLAAYDAAGPAERRARIAAWTAWESIRLARGRALTIGTATITI